MNNFKKFFDKNKEALNQINISNINDFFLYRKQLLEDICQTNTSAKENDGILESVTFEKVAEVIAQLENLVYKKDFEKRFTPNNFPIQPIEENILKKNEIFNHIKKQKIKDYDATKILTISETKKGFYFDAFGTLKDKNNITTALIINSTTNPDTETGQDRQFFKSPLNFNQKNIYLLNKIIKEKHQGRLFKESCSYEIYNLLPFLSMLKKYVIKHMIFPIILIVFIFLKQEFLY